jgi:ribosomal RNA assembly protein
MNWNYGSKVERKTYIRIPQERVGVLIGPKGKAKRRFEKRFEVTLNIESGSGRVDIILNNDAKDVSNLLTVRKIVRAIGRGFSPERAEMVSNEDYDLSILDLRDHVGSSRNALERVKGRIIGKNGRSRALLEDLTKTQVSIYGHTIGIIGSVEGIRVAQEALLMLIKGAFHKTVWNFLYSYRRKMKKELREIWGSESEQRLELKRL